ncbi:MAG: SPASM domain-containing protein, partial [Chloroflexi bacterium]|nr:SPASM domain-containing protein [Chloroflexota bacterium]
LVCTGRGESLTDISAEEYEQALATLSRLQRDFPLIKLRARCAPHFTRLLAEGGTPEAELPVGCMAGAGYLRLTPEGEVTPCPYLPIVVGDLRRDGLSQVWNESPVLAELRAARWRGRCGACRLSARCRGCRARAYAATGDYLGEDPWCTHQPQESDLARPLPAIPWQPEAQRRMERAPGFIRERVMAYIEALAREQGCAEVTVALLDEARQKLPRTGMRFHR